MKIIFKLNNKKQYTSMVNKDVSIYIVALYVHFRRIEPLGLGLDAIIAKSIKSRILFPFVFNVSCWEIKGIMTVT